MHEAPESASIVKRDFLEKGTFKTTLHQKSGTYAIDKKAYTYNLPEIAKMRISILRKISSWNNTIKKNKMVFYVYDTELVLNTLSLIYSTAL